MGRFSGGLTAGDRLRFGLALAGGRAGATTQTAERAYQSQGPAAHVTFRAHVDRASLHWLPQETILFEASHLNRTTEIDLLGGLSACPGGDCSSEHSSDTATCHPLLVEVFRPAAPPAG